MAGWKKAQRHIKYAASSSSLYGRFYHTILLGTDRPSPTINGHSGRGIG